MKNSGHFLFKEMAHNTTALTVRTDLGWDKMAKIMISQCYKTKNLAVYSLLKSTNIVETDLTIPTQQNYFSAGIKFNSHMTLIC